MNEIWGFGLLCFTSFFSLLNPFGVIPIFLSMTSDLDEMYRRYTIRKSIVVTFFTLLVFAFAGQVLFNFFGISVHSFRIAGGIIFFKIGYDMLHAQISSIKISTEEEKQHFATDISITPLAIPMLAGPGSITNAIILMEDAHSLELKLVLIAVIFIICFITFVSLMMADIITKWIGDTGVTVMMRLMGLIMMVMAVEFFFRGLGPIIQKMMI